MSLLLRIKALAEAVGADIKSIKTDPRLTDAREWSGATVTQSEAEGGSATTRRAWTSQRVKQAFVAFFGAISSSLGRTLIGRATPALMRTDLGLGTAATANVGIAAGDVMPVGAGGWLGDVPLYCTDIDDRTQRGMWYVISTTLGSKPSIYGMVNTWGNISDAVYQEFNELSTDPSGLVVRRKFFRTCYSNGEWTPWAIFIGSNNLLQGTGQSTEYPMTQKATTDAINGVSDSRDKTDIANLASGLEFVNALRPVEYRLNMRDKYRKKEALVLKEQELEDGKTETVETFDDAILAKPLTDYDENDGSLAGEHTYTGFVAQELKDTLTAKGLDHYGLVKTYADEYEDGEDRMYIEHTGLIAILTKAVQELSARVEELEAAK